MLQNLIAQFLRKFGYGFVGNVGAMLALGATQYHPQGDPTFLYLWQSVAVGAITGLAAALKRWARFDVTKVGR